MFGDGARGGSFVKEVLETDAFGRFSEDDETAGGQRC